MKIALFGKDVAENALPFVQGLIEKLSASNGSLFIFQQFYEKLSGKIIFPENIGLFTCQRDIRNKVDFLFSIGGDGTILDAISLVGDSGIPVTGVNLGRLGFLSGISREEILLSLEEINQGKYTLESRTLLSLDSPSGLFGEFSYALNDLTVYKSSPMTMISIKVWINGEFLNAYWADGLIVATPTGSTAYSLSCTGPILLPDAENFVITPIASHNLTVRPIVLRDDSEIRIKVENKGNDFLVSLDSRVEHVENTTELIIRKAAFTIRLLKPDGKNFFRTIREKLNWGLDKRNG